MKRLIPSVLFFIYAFAPIAFCAGNAQHIVVIVWPGLRPGMISADNTPTLYQMAKLGTNFENHHAVFPSSGNVNCVAIATGSYPSVSGLIGENEYRTDIEPLKPISTSDVKAIQLGDAQTKNQYLTAPTIAEILKVRTPALYTDCAGTEISSLLLDRQNRQRTDTSRILALGTTLPTPSIDAINDSLGLFPSVTNGNKTVRDTWTTAALTSVFWTDNVPPFSMLYLAEPDYSAQINGPSAFATQEAIQLCDGKLGMVLATLQKHGALEKTDVIVLSDHGISTVSKRVDLIADLDRLGIKAQKSFITPPRKGSVMVIENGACAAIHVTEHDAPTIANIVAALRKLDYAGTIFTRDAIEGTFPLSLAKADSPEAPDILLSYLWTDEPAPGSLHGQTPTSGDSKGVCGSLSPYEMHTAMVAYGPDFKAGSRDTFPTGNIDIAPTILWILGIEPPKTINGRVLTEAMTITGPETPKPETIRKEARFATPDGEWTQHLLISKVGETEYIDEGNAKFIPSK